MVDFNKIKVSDIDVPFVKEYLRIDWDEDDIELNLELEAAKSFLLDHTNKSLEELDNIQFATICLLKLTSDFYHNKLATNNGKNYVADTTMKMLMTKIRGYELGIVSEDEDEGESYGL